MSNPVAPAPAIFDDKKRMKELQERFTVAELMAIQPADRITPTPQERERHQFYLLLLMSLASHFWNGNRRGPVGEYPFRPDQKTGATYQNAREYYGHNIAAIAVDGVGKVIDFDFNHNDLFRSSMEHAEARMLRRLFSLTGLRNSWELGDDQRERTYSTLLQDVTVYTTLEPCAQCAGIMALAKVKEVVYLQSDDGTMRAANVLFNLKPYSYGVKPTPARDYGFDLGETLAAGYERFKDEIKGGKPFFIEPGTNNKDMSSSISSFLCTDSAMYVFREALQQLQKCDHPRHEVQEASKLFVSAAGEQKSAFSNTDVLRDVKAFYEYAVTGGHRGTPH